MQLDAETIGNALIIRVMESRIDAAVAIQFKDRMRGLLNDTPERVIADMTRVDFLDSSGLGAVVASMKHLGPERKLELAGLTPTVAKVFHLTRMDSVLTIHPDLGAALGADANAA